MYHVPFYNFVAVICCYYSSVKQIVTLPETRSETQGATTFPLFDFFSFHFISIFFFSLHFIVYFIYVFCHNSVILCAFNALWIATFSTLNINLLPFILLLYFFVIIIFIRIIIVVDCYSFVYLLRKSEQQLIILAPIGGTRREKREI